MVVNFKRAKQKKIPLVVLFLDALSSNETESLTALVTREAGKAKPHSEVIAAVMLSG